MLIELAAAQKVFWSFDAASVAPSLSPDYVLADGARRDDLTPKFWLYERGPSRLLHGFHLAPIAEAGVFDAQSPYGYGGPLVNDHSVDFLQDAWDAWRVFCKASRIVCEFIRFHPVIGNWRDYRGRTELNRDTVVIDLDQQNLQGSYTTRARGVIRRSERSGYTTSWIDKTEALRTFPDLYYETMRAVAAEGSYFFPSDYFERVIALPTMRCAVFRDEKGVIGSAALFLIGPSLMEYHLSAATLEGRAEGGPSAILHEAAKFGQSTGCSGLYLGGGATRLPDDKLLFFKSGFSAKHLEFHVGSYVHDVEAYEDLKVKYAEAYARFPTHVQFYRS